MGKDKLRRFEAIKSFDNFIVEFPVGVLERAHHKPETVNRFLVHGVVPMLNVETSCKDKLGWEGLTGILHDLRHCFELFGVVACEFLDPLVGRDEVDLVLLTNNFTCEFGLVILLRYVTALIVKQTV